MAKDPEGNLVVVDVFAAEDGSIHLASEDGDFVLRMARGRYMVTRAGRSVMLTSDDPAAV